MTEQYFAENPEVKHDYHQIELVIENIRLQLKSDAGVFSKNRVDYGSIALLEQATKLELTSGKILDVGTGYGPMGLTLAKKYPERQIDLVDVNLRALELAEENARGNGLKNTHVFQSNIYENVSDKYALIMTNPPVRAGKHVVNAIHEGSFEHLLPGGQIITVLQKKQGAPSAKKLLLEVFDNVEILSRDKGYYILRSFKK